MLAKKMEACYDKYLIGMVSFNMPNNDKVILCLVLASKTTHLANTRYKLRIEGLRVVEGDIKKALVVEGW